VLDFVNTVGGRPTFARDDLGDADDILEWAAEAGLLRNADVKPSDGQSSQVRSAIALREQLYLAFGPLAEDDPARAPAIEYVVRRAAQATGSAGWALRGSGYEPSWPQDSIDSICDRLADEAVQLLRSPALARVGSCAGCGWLFLDTSRGHARRWCSMNVCGVRDKMRRYHQRLAHETSAT
jgi:predicted RNA-binding Zn ribbon-like protein